MLKAIVIDDEPYALEVIKNFSEKVVFIEIEGFFTNAFEAMNFLKQHTIDLVFLDIQMPDITGIEFVKSLPNPPMVVFTTAHSEHAVQGFELDAIDFLLKPFSLARFLKACNKAYEQFELKNENGLKATSNAIFIKSGYESVRILLNELLYIESSGNYMQFVTAKQKVLSRLTMNEVEEMMPKSSFLRVHRSYLVAKAHITKMDKKSIWIDKTEIPIGAAYLSQFGNVIN
jgi:DNA-binding LytR/AlgR family response regulator